MQWVLLGLLVAGFCVIEFRLFQDRTRLAPVRDLVTKESVVYRTVISPKWGRGWSGRRWWGRGNGKGMHLVVREHSFELSYPFPGGSFLSTEWYCWGIDASMKMGRGRFLPPWINRDCIVMSIPSIDDATKEQEILIASTPPRGHDLRGAWDALVRCGVHASGDPPPSGS